jgi:hypothetical protein
MTLKVPQLLQLPGILIFIFLMVKGNFIRAGEHLNAMAAFNTTCLAVSVSLISASTFLSLYGFFAPSTSNKKFLLFCFTGGAFLFLMFYFYYEQYSFITRSATQYDRLSLNNTNMLPGIVEGTRNADSQNNREKFARLAYYFYGIKLSYRDNANNWLYYVPTQTEETDHQKLSDFQASLLKLRALSRGVLIATINIVLITFLTFLFGLLWLAIKKSV